MKNISTVFLTGMVCGGLSAAAAQLDLSKLPPASTQKDVTYAKDIRPIFEASCFRCHGEKEQKNHLRLDSLEAVLKGGEDGKVVVAGESAKSVMVIAVARLNPKKAMPPEPRNGRGRRGEGERGPGVQPGTNAPAAGAEGESHNERGRPMMPPPKPLTAAQVGLIRAWIDQGAK
jgi:Planctomycete cytochrome C